MHHIIKCESDYFQLVKQGDKKFELRKDDRDYKLGDTFVLSEIFEGNLTGKHYGKLTINYILKGKEAEKYGIRKGYCIFNW